MQKPMKNEHATKPYLTEPEKFVLRIGWAEDGRYWIWKFDQIPWASLQEKGIISFNKIQIAQRKNFLLNQDE